MLVVVFQYRSVHCWSRQQWPRWVTCSGFTVVHLTVWKTAVKLNVCCEVLCQDLRCRHTVTVSDYQLWRQLAECSDICLSVCIQSQLLRLETQCCSTLQPLTVWPGARHVHTRDKPVTVAAVVQRYRDRVTLIVRARSVLTRNIIHHINYQQLAQRNL